MLVTTLQVMRGVPSNRVVTAWRFWSVEGRRWYLVLSISHSIVCAMYSPSAHCSVRGTHISNDFSEVALDVVQLSVSRLERWRRRPETLGASALEDGQTRVTLRGRIAPGWLYKRPRLSHEVQETNIKKLGGKLLERTFWSCMGTFK